VSTVLFEAKTPGPGSLQGALSVAGIDYVALDDGSIWDREALWLEIERVLRDEHQRRRQPRAKGRPKGSGNGPGSGAGLSEAEITKVWMCLEAWRTHADCDCTPEEVQAFVDAAYPKGRRPRDVSKAATARALNVSRNTFWRYWDNKPWPPA